MNLIFSKNDYESRAFVKKGANHFKYASPQDVIDLQNFLSYIGETDLARIYGKLLFSHPDRYWWEFIRIIGLNIFKENYDQLKKVAESENFDFSNLDSSKSLKKILKIFFDMLKDSYTFRYEMGLDKKAVV